MFYCDAPASNSLTECVLCTIIVIELLVILVQQAHLFKLTSYVYILATYYFRKCCWLRRFVLLSYFILCPYIF